MVRPAGLFVSMSLALTLPLIIPATGAAASRTKIVVDSTDGQPNAGEPELWTGTILRDGPRAREVRECRSVSCERIQVNVKLPDHL